MIIPTRRLLALALVGVIPVAISGSVQLAIFVDLMWIGAVVVAALIDGLLTPNPDRLTWSRTHDAKLSLGVANVINLSMRNESGRRVIFDMRDATPPLLVPAGNRRHSSCEPLDRWSHHYRVWPVHRGEYELGPLTVRYRGPLGLASRQRSWNRPDQATVYPNLLAVRSYESLARRGQLEELGLRATRRRGEGTEFDQLRDYTPDDEFRRINWKATARSGRMIATDYTTERNQNVILVLDGGRVMSTPVAVDEAGGNSAPMPLPALTRFDYAVNAALLLSFVSQQAGDRVGLLSFASGITRFLPPRSGRRGFLAVTEGLHDLEPEALEPDYALGLGFLATRQSQRSLIILFTDIVDTEASSALVAPVLQLARRHLCLTVTLRDPDLTSMARVIPEDTDEVYRRAMAREVLDDRRQALQQLRKRGVLTLDVGADAVSAEAVNTYLEIKARRLL